MNGKAGLFEIFDDVSEGMKKSIQTVAEESRHKRNSVSASDICGL
jgi:hypothetical protein